MDRRSSITMLVLVTSLLLLGRGGRTVGNMIEKEDMLIEEGEEDRGDHIDSVFRPTHEWQEIKKGQTVPAGLHYRINLQTGKKEAKLLEEEGGEKKGDSTTARDTRKTDRTTDVQVSEETENYGHSDRRGVINKSTKVFTRAELREMLKKIKDDSPSSDFIPLLTSSETTNKGKGSTSSTPSPPSSSQSTVDELKEMLTFHVDVEIMLQRLQTLVDPRSTSDELVNALEDIEYYVHQIDNARDFDVLGGLSVVIRLLNYTSDYRVQSAAALVLGAATQGNPVVQQLATSYNALPTLLSLLSPSQSSPSQSSQNELLLRRVLFALGSLMRGQPTVVQSFLSLGGIETLSTLADTSSTVGEVVLIKVIVLLTDVLSVEGLEETTGIRISDIQTRLFNNDWCGHTSHLLQSTTNHVAIEKCVLLMDKLQPVCDYSQQYRLLRKITKQWNRNDQEKELMETVKNMLKRIKSASKNEL